MKKALCHCAAVLLCSASIAGTLSVETGNAIQVWNDFSRTPVAVISNETGRALSACGAVVCTERTGSRVEVPVAGEIPPGGTLRVPLALPPVKGLWEVTARLADGVAFATRFAATDAHDFPEKWPRGMFRPGIQFHMHPQWCKTKEERDTGFEAVRLLGARLVRFSGLGMSQIEPEEGKFDWTLADELIGEAARRGLAIDAVMYSPPKWAWKEGKAGLPPDVLRQWWRFACRPGPLRDFFRAVAARYGEKIDY